MARANRYAVSAWGLPAAAAAAAGALVSAATARHGLSLSPDSAVYLSSADHLLRGDGLTSYTGHTLVLFPPGFPVVVAAISWILQVDVATAARILNGISVAAIAGSACVLLRRHVESRVLQFAAAAVFAAAAPLVEVAAHAWSDALFVALALLGVLAIEGLSEHPTRPGLLATAVLVVASAFLVRYLGLVLVVTAVGSVLVSHAPTRPGVQRLSAAVVTGTLMTAVPAAWVVRNLVVSGAPFGGRDRPHVALTEQLRRTASEIASWVVPRYAPAPLRLAGLALAVAIAIACVLTLVSRRRGHDGGRRGPSLVPLALFSLSYLVLLEAAAARTQIDPLGARLLSPLFVPAVVIGLALLERSGRTALQGRRVATAVLALAVASWAALGVAAGAKRAVELAAGNGYNGAAWRGSALAKRLRESPPTGTLFSNRPDAVWATTRLDARCLPPQLGRHVCVGSSGDPDDLRALESSRARAEVAWFAGPAGPAPPAAPGPLRFRLLARAGDGALYAVDAGR